MELCPRLKTHIQEAFIHPLLIEQREHMLHLFKLFGIGALIPRIAEQKTKRIGVEIIMRLSSYPQVVDAEPVVDDALPLRIDRKEGRSQDSVLIGPAGAVDTVIEVVVRHPVYAETLVVGGVKFIHDGVEEPVLIG